MRWHRRERARTSVRRVHRFLRALGDRRVMAWGGARAGVRRLTRGRRWRPNGRRRRSRHRALRTLRVGLGLGRLRVRLRCLRGRWCGGMLRRRDVGPPNRRGTVVSRGPSAWLRGMARRTRPQRGTWVRLSGVWECLRRSRVLRTRTLVRPLGRRPCGTGRRRLRCEGVRGSVRSRCLAPARMFLGSRRPPGPIFRCSLRRTMRPRSRARSPRKGTSSSLAGTSSGGRSLSCPARSGR